MADDICLEIEKAAFGVFDVILDATNTFNNQNFLICFQWGDAAFSCTLTKWKGFSFQH